MKAKAYTPTAAPSAERYANQRLSSFSHSKVNNFIYFYLNQVNIK